MAVAIKQNYTTANTSGKGNTKEYIILHHTATGRDSVQGVINHFLYGPVSCHYTVDTNGDIYKINTDSDILWHAGQSQRGDKVNMNQYSIGIEIIGPLPGFTNAQRVAVRVLVLSLMRLHTIPTKNILRHKDIAPGRKVDVADSFRNDQYTTYSSYQQSYADFISTGSLMGRYERIFKEEFADLIARGETIIKDPDKAVTKLMNADGTINLKEVIYFMNIGFERIRSEAKEKYS